MSKFTLADEQVWRFGRGRDWSKAALPVALLLSACAPTGDEYGQITQEATVAEGVYSIAGVQSGKCVDVQGASQDDGANVQQWRCDGRENQ